MEVVIMILQVIGVIIGILIGLFILELAIVAFVPGVSVPEQHLEKATQLTKEVDTKPSWSRKDVSFKVKGTALSAWLYLPEDLSAPVPCIIMGHGFGGTKDMILEPYARRYLEAGFAVLMQAGELSEVRGPIPTLLKTKLAKLAVDKGANTDYNLGHNER